MQTRRVGLIGATVLSAFLLGGCLLPLMVGAGAGVGGYAWVQGYLKRTYTVSPEHAAQVCERTVEALGFEILSSKYDKFGGKISGKRAPEGALDSFIIELERAGNARTLIKVRVGIPGDRSLAEEVHKEIAKRL